MCWVVDALLMPVIPNLIAGLISGYVVGRHFEFRIITQRAMYSLRLFARDADAARNALDELQMARDQLVSHGFNSGREPLQRIIDWAQSHYNDATIEPSGKRDQMMPLLENLRPRFYELFKLSR